MIARSLSRGRLATYDARRFTSGFADFSKDLLRSPRIIEPAILMGPVIFHEVLAYTA